VQATRKHGLDPEGVDTSTLQRRTLAVLIVTQMVGGIGVAIGIAVGALLAARMGGTQISGLGQSSLVVGAALLAVPVTRLMARRGRRPGLALAYLIGAAGAALVVFAAASGSVPLLFVGLFAFGGGSAANYQARYTAVDLASPEKRGRQLSWVVWATTVGSVAGPNLAQVADDSVRRFGAVKYSGPFVFSAAAFLVAGVIVFLLLRPDPLLTARLLAGVPAVADRVDDPVADAGPDARPVVDAGPIAVARPVVDARPAAAGPARGGIRAAAREVLASPSARLGVAAVAVGHLVMVGVMAMTPVHIDQAGTDHGDTLRIIGIVLSIHIAGMYALSPVTGWLTDRLGRRAVILGGVALLVAACAVAGTAGHDTAQLSAGLLLLGMGWSGTMVAGSTLLSESVGVANRPSVQGLSDLVMGLAAASAGALSGLVVAWASYPTLTVLAAVATVPLVALALRPVRGAT
jgi:MFS family permease